MSWLESMSRGACRRAGAVHPVLTALGETPSRVGNEDNLVVIGQVVPAAGVLGQHGAVAAALGDEVPVAIGRHDLLIASQVSARKRRHVSHR
eukprot:scaffold115704_cov75-Phaeocystis_antarctica.AAC.2